VGDWVRPGADPQIRPRRDRDVRAAHHVEYAQRVHGGVLQGHVSGDRGHREQVDRRVRDGEHDRQGVVVTRIAVEDDGDRHD
jgi:hypothetical protein